jgi:hypothetical protein
VALASLVLLVLAAAPSEANIVSDRSLQEGIPAEIAASTEVPVCELACEHSTLPNASCTGCECKGLYSGNLCQKCKTTSECDLGSIWSEETCDCVAETDKEDDACITETCYGNGSCTKEPVDCNDGNPCEWRKISALARIIVYCHHVTKAFLVLTPGPAAHSSQAPMISAMAVSAHILLSRTVAAALLAKIPSIRMDLQACCSSPPLKKIPSRETWFGMSREKRMHCFACSIWKTTERLRARLLRTKVATSQKISL